MDRSIFKKITSVALTAAVMITNIGITSAAAQGLPSFSETVRAEDVGAVNAFAEDIEFENVKHNSVSGMIDYSQKGMGHVNELIFNGNGCLTLRYYGSRTKRLTDDELKLFYFSTDRAGTSKFSGLTVTGAAYKAGTDISTNKDYTDILLLVSFDYTGRSFDNPSTQYEVYLCYPHTNASGSVEKVVITGDDSASGQQHPTMTMYLHNAPKKFYRNDGSHLELVPTSEYSQILSTTPLVVEDLNGNNVSDGFTAEYYSGNVMVTMKKGNPLVSKKITADKNYLYKVKRTDMNVYICTFYLENNPSGGTEAEALTPEQPPSPAVSGRCLPDDFDPKITFTSDPNAFGNSNDYLYYMQYPGTGSLLLANQSTITLEARSGDTKTAQYLENLTEEQLSLFYFGDLSGNPMSVDGLKITGYDKTSKELSFVFDAASVASTDECKIYRSGKVYLCYPQKGSGTTINKVALRDINGDAPNGFQVLGYFMPAKWDIGANDTITIKTTTAIAATVDELSVLDKNGQEVNDFEITAKNDVYYTIKIKSESNLLESKITPYNDRLYQVVKKNNNMYTNNSVYCNFFIVNDPNTSSSSSSSDNSGGSDNPGNDPDNPANDPETPVVPMAGSILRLPASKTANYSFSIAADGTLKCGSEAVKKDSDSESNIVISGVDDISKVKWVLETPDTYPKASGKAKFKNEKGKAAATVTGDKATIINTAANNKLNSTVILKLVSDGYKAATSKKAQTGTVYAQKTIYITPAVPTAWTDVKGKLTKAGITQTDDAEGYDEVYNMSIADGKSVKLPFTPKDGADKTMIYEIGEGAKGFSVVNGTVKALAGGGSGDVICYPKFSPNKRILVHVTTTAFVKSLRANTNKVTVYPNSSQTIYLGTVPPSFDTVFTIDSKTSGTFNGGTWTISGNALIVTGGESVTSATKTTLAVSGGGKTLKIIVAGAAAPQNAKNFKLITKKLNADGFIEVNIPVCTVYNLGVAVNPVNANADFDWKYSAVEPDPSAVLSDNDSVIAAANSLKDIQVSGDVVKGNATCTYYMQAVSKALGADGNALRTAIYKIKVYEPGSTVVMNPLPSEPISGAEEFTVVGGYLMSKTNADTDCNNKLTGGKTYTFPVPTTAGAVHEDIIWSCNKPAAISLDTSSNQDYMVLTPLQTGTFTVTGMTGFTKQKITFKVNSVSTDSGIDNAAAGDYTIQYQKTDGTWSAIKNETFPIKQKFNIRAYSAREGAIGTIKFTTTTASYFGLNASGIITTKAAGGSRVGAVVTFKKSDKSSKTITIPDSEFSFNVTAPTAEFKSVSVPIGVIKGEKGKFAASVKNVKPSAVKWEYANSTDAKDWTAISGATSLSGKFTVDIPAGTHYVRCNADGVTSEAKSITVYAADQNIKSASFKCTVGDKGVVASYNKMVSDLNGSREGAGAAYGYYYLLVFATPNDSSQELTAAGTDDIVWTSSNVNLATAETVSRWSYEGNQGSVDSSLKKSAYAIVRIDTSVAQANKYTGKVTITGILKNSGKKISVTLNLRKEAGSIPDYYHPGDDIPSFGPITANTDLDIDVGSFKYLLDQNVDEAYGEGSQKEYRYSHQWALSKNSSPSGNGDVVYLEGNELKGIDDTGSCDGKVTLNISQEKINTLKSLTQSETYNGLCYLVEVYKVKISHTDGSGTTWENDDHFHSVVCGNPFIISEKSPSND